MGSHRYLQSKGILCLADEVQTGFGRTGTHFWAFQSYEEGSQGSFNSLILSFVSPLDVIPDFVTMGKSMGNGFPVSALMTRRDITEKFDINGVEYFNTYGGNPVSCRAAIAVFDVLEKENLMEHARTVGSYLLNKMKELGQRYAMIGDVRGRGLFIGIELVRDPKTREPATEEARTIKYR